jgi:hypothetical protein
MANGRKEEEVQATTGVYRSSQLMSSRGVTPHMISTSACLRGQEAQSGKGRDAFERPQPRSVAGRSQGNGPNSKRRKRIAAGVASIGVQRRRHDSHCRNGVEGDRSHRAAIRSSPEPCWCWAWTGTASRRRACPRVALHGSKRRTTRKETTTLSNEERSTKINQQRERAKGKASKQGRAVPRSPVQQLISTTLTNRSK